MKKKVSVFLCCVLTLCSFVFCVQALQTPVISFSSQSLDFGEVVYKVDAGELEITLTNNSDETVIFSNANLSSNAVDSVFCASSIDIDGNFSLLSGTSQKYTLTVRQDVEVGAYTESFSVSASSPDTTACFTATVTVIKAKPALGKLPVLQAVYGMYLYNVPLPCPDNGTFAWSGLTPRSLTVGEIGENEFEYLTFTPADTKNYEIAENIKVTVNVQKAKPDVTIPTLSAVCGQTLDKVKKPDGWYWNVKSPENVRLKYGTSSHSATFTPKDTEHYLSLLQELKINTAHDFSDDYQYNKDGHFKVCVCTAVADMQPHELISCTEENSTRVYEKCTVCGYKNEPHDVTSATDTFTQFITKLTQFFKQIADWLKSVFSKNK